MAIANKITDLSFHSEKEKGFLQRLTRGIQAVQLSINNSAEDADRHSFLINVRWSYCELANKIVVPRE